MTSTIIIYRQQTRGYVYNCKIPFEHKKHNMMIRARITKTESKVHDKINSTP